MGGRESFLGSGRGKLDLRGREILGEWDGKFMLLICVHNFLFYD